ncbi:MAG: hypothetical protein U0Y10_24430 [Spirosomataceae bacterium]
MPTFQDLFDQIKTSSVDLAKESFDEFFTEAKQDADGFLNDTRDKLERWTTLLMDGLLDKDEFEMLVKSLKTSAKMEFLLQKGITKIKIERFLRKLLGLVVDTAFNALK